MGMHVHVGQQQTGITLALSSQHPALHSLYTSIEHSPPVPLLNAAAAVAAAVGMAVGGNSLEVSGRNGYV